MTHESFNRGMLHRCRGILRVLHRGDSEDELSSHDAHGYFELDQSLAAYTSAASLQEAGARTPVFVRFSTVAGSRGSTDLARDVRGFAIKFYTEQGNFDLVGNDMPVSFIQDAIKFPDLVHAVKPEPHNEIPQAASAHDTFWDFISLTPEFRPKNSATEKIYRRTARLAPLEYRSFCQTWHADQESRNSVGRWFRRHSGEVIQPGDCSGWRAGESDRASWGNRCRRKRHGAACRFQFVDRLLCPV